jgi:hypothetical protein
MGVGGWLKKLLDFDSSIADQGTYKRMVDYLFFTMLCSLAQRICHLRRVDYI